MLRLDVLLIVVVTCYLIGLALGSAPQSVEASESDGLIPYMQASSVYWPSDIPPPQQPPPQALQPKKVSPPSSALQSCGAKVAVGVLGVGIITAGFYACCATDEHHHWVAKVYQNGTETLTWMADECSKYVGGGLCYLKDEGPELIKYLWNGTNWIPYNWNGVNDTEVKEN